MMNNRIIRPDPYLYIGYVPQPRTKRVWIDGTPDFLHNIRAALCTDVHLRSCTSDRRLRAIVDTLADAKADILFLGGDYGEGAAQCDRFFNALARVRFPLGVYAVPGNNDLTPPNDPNVHYLINREEKLDICGGTLLIGGIDDYKYGTPDARKLFRRPADYRILLSHFPVLAECPADLMLSGHTHGGQINVLGITPYSACFERKYQICAVRGLNRFGNLQAYVSCGIGNSKLPVRLGAAPEITVIEFR